MTSPPLLTISELRAHCRVDDPMEDGTLLACAAAAQAHVEEITGQILTRRSVFFRAPQFPVGGWTLPQHPVLAVERIDYADGAGTPQTVPPEVFTLAQENGHSILRPRQGAAWPSTAPDSEVAVQLLAGYPDGECPPPLRHACLLLSAHFYENREAAPAAQGSSALSEMPFAVSALVAPFRRHLLT